MDLLGEARNPSGSLTVLVINLPSTGVSTSLRVSEWFCRVASTHSSGRLHVKSNSDSSSSTCGSHVQTEVKQPLLPVVCPLCKIEEIANQESESSSLPLAESVSLQFSSDDHVIPCHLSLPGIPRARFAKVAQFCGTNNAPVARPFLRLAMRAE